MQPHRTTSDLDNLIDEIQFEMPEAAYDAIVLHLRRSIIKFCEDSHYWQEDIGPVRVVSVSNSYDLPLSRSIALVGVMSVSTADKVFERCETDDVKYRFWQDSPFSILLYPNDEFIGQDLSIAAALKPTIQGDAFKVSESLVEQYRDALIAGAKAALYKTPRKPWTDLNQAQINDSIFDAIASDALRHVARGHLRVPDRTPNKVREFY